MMDLLGKRCACVFNLPMLDWPIPGSPAFVRVLDVSMPMVKMVSDFGGEPMWVNAAVIRTIKARP